MGQRVNDGRAEQPLIERIKREQRRYEIARDCVAAAFGRDIVQHEALLVNRAVAMADALLAALEAPDGR